MDQTPTTKKKTVPHHLPSRHTHRLDRELSATHIEQILQTRAEEIDDEDVVEAFLPEMIDLWDPRCPAKELAVHPKTMTQKGYVRHPDNIRYERHSSRSWGASAFRGS